MAFDESIMKQPEYEVAIVGAGPSGALAAALLAGNGRRVLLIDKSTPPIAGIGIDWISPQSETLLNQAKVRAKSLFDHPVREVTFRSWDLSKTAAPKSTETVAYLVDRATLSRALREAAGGAGANVVEAQTVRGLKLLEDQVVLEVEGEESFAARLLLLATGAGSGLPLIAGFPRASGAAVVTGRVDQVLEKGGGTDRIAVILGLDRAGSFATCCLEPDQLSVSLVWRGEPGHARPTLGELCRKLHQQKLTPVDLLPAAATAPLIQEQAVSALDLDTHVGKHTLLIGDAGGFRAGISQESIYPALWSAQLASEVLQQALESKQSQDELMTFEQRWRTTMADYLRPPNTDMQFLMPLVFSNQLMAERMAAAFFAGENI